MPEYPAKSKKQLVPTFFGGLAWAVAVLAGVNALLLLLLSILAKSSSPNDDEVAVKGLGLVFLAIFTVVCSARVFCARMAGRYPYRLF